VSVGGERVCSFRFLPRPASGSTLVPYTTLFRSVLTGEHALRDGGPHDLAHALALTGRHDLFLDDAPQHVVLRLVRHERDLQLARSEEHTSELQSRENLVCRLLLEKKQK